MEIGDGEKPAKTIYMAKKTLRPSNRKQLQHLRGATRPSSLSAPSRSHSLPPIVNVDYREDAVSTEMDIDRNRYETKLKTHTTALPAVTIATETSVTLVVMSVFPLHTPYTVMQKRRLK